MTMRRHWALLLVSILALSGVIAFITGRITTTRHRRDLLFGIEQLDILIDDARATADGDDALYDEAAAMIPWLAARARTATDAIRVLRRAYSLHLYGRTDPLLSATTLLRNEFPGNEAIRRVTAYALVRSGDPVAALSHANPDSRRAARTDADREIDGALFAWSLLSADEGGAETTPLEAIDDRAGGYVALVSLGTDSDPQDFVRAWELTADWRYAQLAAILFMARARPDDAVDIATRSGLDFHAPLLIAGVLLDRGEFDAAAALLRPVRQTTRVIERRADIALYAGQHDQARELLRLLVPELVTPETLVNLAWLSGSADERESLIGRALDRFPDSPVVVEQAARFYAGTDGDRARRVLAERSTVAFASRPIVEITIDPSSTRRRAAAVWDAVHESAAEATFRYAAWHFLAYGDRHDLSLLVDRAGAALGHEPAWLGLYRGVLAAQTGAWGDASDHFEASFAARPDWPSAHNAAVAYAATGNDEAAATRIRNATLLASYPGRAGSDPLRARVFVTAARLSSDRQRSVELLDTALELSPGLAEALLLRTQLDPARRR